MRRPARRSGYTIMELVVVCGVILLLGAAIAPTLSTFWADGRTKAAVDIVQSRLADARGQAVTQGRNFQVLASPDGTQVRVGADPAEQDEATDSANAGGQTSTFGITSTLPTTVVLTPGFVGSSGTSAAGSAASSNGWTLLVTFKPDGTCLEDSSEFTLAEPGVVPQVVRVRGLTGTVAVNAQ